MMDERGQDWPLESAQMALLRPRAQKARRIVEAFWRAPGGRLVIPAATLIRSFRAEGVMGLPTRTLRAV